MMDLLLVLMTVQYGATYSQIDVIFQDDMSNGNNFMYSPTVQFVSDALCQNTICAKIPLTDPATYFQTKLGKISTIGYTDIVLKFDIAVTAFGTGEFSITTKLHASGPGINTPYLETIAHDTLTQNQIYYQRQYSLPSSIENIDTPAIYFSALRTSGTPFVFINNILVTGTKITQTPTKYPTTHPTTFTATPTINPTFNPTMKPTVDPTAYPTINPSVYPTLSPTMNPSVYPTIIPSILPSIMPTTTPTKTNNDGEVEENGNNHKTTSVLDNNLVTSHKNSDTFWVVMGIVFAALCICIAGFCIYIKRKIIKSRIDDTDIIGSRVNGYIMKDTNVKVKKQNLEYMNTKSETDVTESNTTNGEVLKRDINISVVSEDKGTFSSGVSCDMIIED
eukprot:263717_1